jgi:YebC/PmpR family DNA-binding regulatory protein
MSGHSKWATIKHKKGKADIARGKLFSKLIRELTIAARSGGGDPNSNPRLRTIVESAREANMPMDNIDRAIKKGTGELPGTIIEEVTYEGYGPAGVALMIRVLSDNKNRTTAEIRHIFEKYNGSMGTANSVAWQFHPKGVISIAREKADEDTVLTLALEAGADDVLTEAAGYTVLTPPDTLEEVKKVFKEKGIVWESAELSQEPQNTVQLDEKDADKVLRLVEQFEDQEDVQQVFGNYAISDEVMAALEKRE